MPEGSDQERRPSDASPVHIKIFLSSPGDVEAERRSAQRIIEKDLAKDPLLKERVTFRLINWNDPENPLPFTANATPQEAVNHFGERPGKCDIVIVVLWSRLGTHLDISTFSKPSGEPYQSGTEWEYEDALAGNPQPDVLVYRRMQKPQIDIDDTDLAAKQEQYSRVNRFFEGFTNPDGSAAQGFVEYLEPEAFEQRLERDLRSVLNKRVALTDPESAQRIQDLERIAEEERAAKETLQREVERLRGQVEGIRDSSAQDAAVEALAEKAREPAPPPGIEVALRSLAAGDTGAAEALFRRGARTKSVGRRAQGSRKREESKGSGDGRPASGCSRIVEEHGRSACRLPISCRAGARGFLVKDLSC